MVLLLFWMLLLLLLLVVVAAAVIDRIDETFSVDSIVCDELLLSLLLLLLLVLLQLRFVSLTKLFYQQARIIRNVNPALFATFAAI